MKNDNLYDIQLDVNIFSFSEEFDQKKIQENQNAKKKLSFKN